MFEMRDGVRSGSGGDGLGYIDGMMSISLLKGPGSG